MPEVASLAEAVRERLLVYQLFSPTMPEGLRFSSGATVSSQKDLEAETVRPALSTARRSTLCLPSGRASSPAAGNVIQLPPSWLYWKADSPDPGVGSEAEALRVAALYQLLEPSVPLILALKVGLCVSIEAL